MDKNSGNSQFYENLNKASIISSSVKANANIVKNIQNTPYIKDSNLQQKKSAESTINNSKKKVSPQFFNHQQNNSMSVNNNHSIGQVGRDGLLHSKRFSKSIDQTKQKNANFSSTKENNKIYKQKEFGATCTFEKNSRPMTKDSVENIKKLSENISSSKNPQKVSNL